MLKKKLVVENANCLQIAVQQCNLATFAMFAIFLFHETRKNAFYFLKIDYVI